MLKWRQSLDSVTDFQSFKLSFSVRNIIIFETLILQNLLFSKCVHRVTFYSLVIVVFIQMDDISFNEVFNK